MKNKFSMIAFGLALIIVGCGGGGGGSSSGGTTPTTGGAATSLKVAEKLSVVGAQSSGSQVAPLKIGKLHLAPPNATANSDWNKDVTVVYVAERSTESYGTINEILCSLAQAKYDAMLNKGDYKALVDKNQCSSKKSDASSAGQSSSNQSSGSTMPDYETWVLNSSRTDNTAPQYVKFWIHTVEGPEEQPGVIYVMLTITESTSSTNPYGIFKLNFKGHPVNPVTGAVDTNTVMFKGYLNSERDSSGKILLKFAMDGSGGTAPNNWSMSERVTFDRAADGLTGAGTSAVSDSFGGQSKTANFNMAFNQQNFLRADYPGNTNQICLSRTDFDETAWRYGLYDDNGMRVIRNSGFPIKYTDASGTNYHGWVGYWGMWLSETVTINDNATVYKQTYGPGGGAEIAYTLIKKGGKLKKHTQKLLTLADIKNIPLNYWDAGTNYQVLWDGSQFKIVAKQNQTNWTLEQCGGAVICPTSIDLTKLTWDMLNFWSQALGGNVQVKLNCPSASGTTWPPVCNNTTSASNTSKVVFYAEDIVYPGDFGTTVTFACYGDQCPDPNAFATLTDTNSGNDNPYFTNQITIPTATITVDGGTTDWTGISALTTDPSGDSSASYTGDDIKALYVAKDATNLYIRMDLWENANTNFWNFPSPNEGSYRFQIESNSSTYPLLGLGVAYCGFSGQPCYGQWSLGANGSNGPAPSSLQGPGFVGVSGSTIEIRIPLSVIGNPTAFRGITADVNNCCVQDAFGNWLPPTTLDVSEVLVKHDYTFDPTVNGMVLKSGTTDVVLTGTITSQQYQWGVMSGPIFDPTAVDSTTGKTYLQLLACDWDPGRTCGWKAGNTLPLFYTWETGPAQWSQFTALKDATDAVLKFESPLQVQYTYQKSGNTAADNKYCLDGATTCANGSKFYLEYAGFGELHGIPGKCVDMDTGQDVNCGQGGSSIRWVSEFSIPTGATVTTQLNGTSATYHVKSLEKEQRMKAVLSGCSILTLADYPLPSMTLVWQDPSIGAEPSVTGAPAVIGGVVQ